VIDWQQKSDACLTERCLRDDIAAQQRCCLPDFAHCYWRYRPRALRCSRASTRFAHVGATATQGSSFTRRFPEQGARRACLSLPAAALSAGRLLSASGQYAPRRITTNRRGLASYAGPDPRMSPAPWVGSPGITRLLAARWAPSPPSIYKRSVPSAAVVQTNRSVRGAAQLHQEPSRRLKFAPSLARRTELGFRRDGGRRRSLPAILRRCGTALPSEPVKPHSRTSRRQRPFSDTLLGRKVDTAREAPHGSGVHDAGDIERLRDPCTIVSRAHSVARICAGAASPLRAGPISIPLSLCGK
jgi:hypothetical protein